jgi:hypothetical protein
MIRIDTKKYVLEIEIDGVITPVRVYPLSTETSLVLSELWDTKDRISKKIDSITKKMDKLKEENPESQELEKLSKESFDLQRQMIEVLNKFFQVTIVDFESFKPIFKMIPINEYMNFLNDVFEAMQGNKKKLIESNPESIESETKSDSEKLAL